MKNLVKLNEKVEKDNRTSFYCTIENNTIKYVKKTTRASGKVKVYEDEIKLYGNFKVVGNYLIIDSNCLKTITDDNSVPSFHMWIQGKVDPTIEMTIEERLNHKNLTLVLN